MKAMVKAILVGLLMMSFCATYTMLGLSEAEKDYYRVVMKFPTTFRVPKEADKEAWMRAHKWITNYSRRPIIVANERVIQTTIPKPSDPNTDRGYIVYRNDDEDSTVYSVDCYSMDLFTEPGIRAAHILAYYIATGGMVEKVFRQ
ncbi:MAG: hypothetical protein KBA26_12060 [Candidatus Delongbacteria bacterium]|nr:hypothetical protein [Candidatus Delongbacteria bacterium]